MAFTWLSFIYSIPCVCLICAGGHQSSCCRKRESTGAFIADSRDEAKNKQSTAQHEKHTVLVTKKDRKTQRAKD